MTESAPGDVYLGLDIGTQGVRAVVCAVWDDDGPRSAILARAAQPFPAGTVVTDLPPGHAEQHPAGWWAAVVACLRQVATQTPLDAIRALSVTSTSGTLCLLDDAGDPLVPALMYNDGRSGQEALEVQAAGSELAARLGYRFNASFALAKLLWLARHRPDVLARVRYIAHAADTITGRLSGRYDVTDYSNALKTGYDLAPVSGDRPAGCWPDFIGAALGLPVDRLPQVVAPGTVIGEVTPAAAAAEMTGLRAGTLVVAGMTDGCAAQIASGAVSPGDWNSTLGTTLVLKGVTAQLIRDPQGRIYSHRHPDGYWLPGGASNVGGEILATRFPGADLVSLDAQATQLSPTDLIVYPLARRGERFPFVRADAEGFLVPFGLGRATRAGDPAVLYAAYLEGVAYVERLAYETLAGLGATVAGAIRVAGGAAASDVWLQIRADVLGRKLVRPAETGAAMGAAILAAAGASRARFDSLAAAARTMVRIERVVTPRSSLAASYDERYRRFCAACAERGYI